MVNETDLKLLLGKLIKRVQMILILQKSIVDPVVLPIKTGYGELFLPGVDSVEIFRTLGCGITVFQKQPGEGSHGSITGSFRFERHGNAGRDGLAATFEIVHQTIIYQGGRSKPALQNQRIIVVDKR